MAVESSRPMVSLIINHHFTQVTFHGYCLHLDLLIKNLVSYEVRTITGRLRQNSLYTYGRFPTGCLQHLLCLLKEQKIPHTVDDRRGPPTSPVSAVPLDGIEYRPYQLSGIVTGLSHSRLIFQWPPGTGKTELVMGIIKSLGKMTLWLCSSKNVLQQTRDRWEQRGGNPNQIFFTMPQALESKTSKFKSSPSFYDVFGCLVVDECHHTPAKTWYKVAMKCNASHRFAISATPFEIDDNGLHLRAAISDYYHSVSYEDCYRDGHLSRPHVRMRYYNGDPGWDPSAWRGKDYWKDLHRKPAKGKQFWHDLYENGIASNATRNAAAILEARRYLSQGFPCLILAKLVKKHAHPLLKLARQSFGENRVQLITGECTVPEREAAIESLVEKRTIDVLISTKILNEGQDIPRLAAVINLVAGNSRVQSTQIIGRVMRPQSPAFLTDFVDLQHSLLLKHSGQREEAYQAVGATVDHIGALE